MLSWCLTDRLAGRLCYRGALTSELGPCQAACNGLAYAINGRTIDRLLTSTFASCSGCHGAQSLDQPKVLQRQCHVDDGPLWRQVLCNAKIFDSPDMCNATQSRHEELGACLQRAQCSCKAPGRRHMEACKSLAAEMSNNVCFAQPAQAGTCWYTLHGTRAPRCVHLAVLIFGFFHAIALATAAGSPYRGPNRMLPQRASGR